MIWTNKSCNLDKYILQFRQIFFQVCSLGLSLSNVVSKPAQVSGALNAFMGTFMFPFPQADTTHNTKKLWPIIQTSLKMQPSKLLAEIDCQISSYQIWTLNYLELVHIDFFLATLVALHFTQVSRSVSGS